MYKKILYCDACNYLSNLFWYCSFIFKSFPGDLAVKNLPAKQELQETGIRSLGGEGTLERAWQHTPASCWRTPWTGELAGYSPQGCKELDTTEATWHMCTFIFKVY